MDAALQGLEERPTYNPLRHPAGLGMSLEVALKRIARREAAPAARSGHGAAAAGTAPPSMRTPLRTLHGGTSARGRRVGKRGGRGSRSQGGALQLHMATSTPSGASATDSTPRRPSIAVAADAAMAEVASDIIAELADSDLWYDDDTDNTSFVQYGSSEGAAVTAAAAGSPARTSATSSAWPDGSVFGARQSRPAAAAAQPASRVHASAYGPPPAYAATARAALSGYDDDDDDCEDQLRPRRSQGQKRLALAAMRTQQAALRAPPKRPSPAAVARR